MQLQHNEVNDFWNAYESEVRNFAELSEKIAKILKKSIDNKLQFVWRGQSDAAWPLHSSLYRRIRKLDPSADINEIVMQTYEGELLKELHRWGLHTSREAGHISVLNQLAILQHYGAPTRLIDITFNAWIGVWFAVEQKWKSGKIDSENESTDARLFAIDISNRLINESDAFRQWEDKLGRPWKYENKSKDFKKDWETTANAWRPSSVDGRIFAQNGGFLLGGVPSVATTGTAPFQIPRGQTGAGNWLRKEVRMATSVAVRPHKFDAKRGAATTGSMFTFRIKGEAKAEIRTHLEKIFGYRHATLYPDFTGFAEFGNPKLPR